MTEMSQAAFKSQFRAGIPADYNGFRHALKMLAIGIGVIAACLLLLRRPVSLWEWAMIPSVVIAWNFVEWSVHKYILHYPRKNKIARALYNRHTLTHHQFFTEADPVFALLAWALISANATLLVIASLTGIYLLFEVMHFCAHIPENRFVRYCPLVNTMRRHHIAHHNQKLMMRKNMNFTLPLADWLMGTSDLDRGLLGTIFNGSTKRYVVSDRPQAANQEVPNS